MNKIIHHGSLAAGLPLFSLSCFLSPSLSLSWLRLMSKSNQSSNIFFFVCFALFLRRMTHFQEQFAADMSPCFDLP